MFYPARAGFVIFVFVIFDALDSGGNCGAQNNPAPHHLDFTTWLQREPCGMSADGAEGKYECIYMYMNIMAAPITHTALVFNNWTWLQVDVHLQAWLRVSTGALF